MTPTRKVPEKRGVFREVARLSLNARFTATEFGDTVHSALRGLIQEKSAASSRRAASIMELDAGAE
jgi:hypothetical protein